MLTSTRRGRNAGTPLRCLTAAGALGLALAAHPVGAQSLLLGNNQPVSSGSAAISSAGTVAAGDYQFFDSGGNAAPLDPGTTSYSGITGYHASSVNVSGGNVDRLYFNGDGVTNPTADISGGTLGEVLFISHGNGDATVSGGSITQLLFEGPDQANSSVTVSGGSITSLGTSGLDKITGGSIGQLFTIGGTDALSGGSFGQIVIQDFTQVNVTGGKIASLQSYSDGGTYDFFGTDFSASPVSGQYGFYRLQGVLQNGDPLNVEFEDTPGSRIQFNSVDVPLTPVPEASQAVSFGLLMLLGLGGLVAASRRKKA